MWSVPVPHKECVKYFITGPDGSLIPFDIPIGYKNNRDTISVKIGPNGEVIIVDPNYPISAEAEWEIIKKAYDNWLNTTMKGKSGGCGDWQTWTYDFLKAKAIELYGKPQFRYWDFGKVEWDPIGISYAWRWWRTTIGGNNEGAIHQFVKLSAKGDPANTKYLQNGWKWTASSMSGSAPRKVPD